MCFISSLVSKLIRRYGDILALYEELSKGYAHWRGRGWDIVKILRGRYIADVGSGHCIQGLTLLRTGGTEYVLCMDISPRMLETGKRRFGEDLLDFIAMDLSSIPLRRNSLNGIIAIAVLHHLSYEELTKALKEARHVLKRKGVILITTWSPWQSRFITQLVITYLLKILDPRVKPRVFLIPWRRRGKKLLRVYVLYTLKEITEAMRGLGFRILSYGYYSPWKRGSSNVYVVAVNP